MSKEEYLNQLHKYLRKLPKQDYDDAMDYFEEYFQETDEAGAQKLIEEMGTPKEAARELIANLLDKKMDCLLYTSILRRKRSGCGTRS